MLVLPQVQEVRHRFEAAWEESLRSGSQPPDLDSFLGGIGEAELLTLQGAGHGFKGKDAEAAERAMLAFFANHLKTK